MAWQLARMLAVVALVCVAAALLTPRDRLPPALRGLRRLLRRASAPEERAPVAPPWKRALAFALVLLAAFLCLLEVGR